MRRLLVALALSLAVHGTFLFLVRKSPVPVPPSAPTWVAELEIVERPAAAPPERPKSAEPTASAQAALVREPPTRKPAPRTRSVARSGEAPAQREVAVSDVPLRPRQGETPFLPHQEETLPGLLPGLRHTLPPSSPEPDEPIIDGLSGIHAPAIPKDLVGATVAQAVGQRRGQSGNVDPYFSRLRERLTEIWNTHRSDGKISDRPGAIRITQGRSGHLVSAELVSSFSDPRWNRGLLLDLKQAAHLLPEPPPEVFSEHRYLSSLWSFQYSPGALTDFDIVNLFDKKAIPKSDSKRVQLLGAEPSD